MEFDLDSITKFILSGYSACINENKKFWEDSDKLQNDGHLTRVYLNSKIYRNELERVGLWGSNVIEMPSIYPDLRKYPGGTNPDWPTYGCLLTHVSIWEEILIRNLPYAIVLEDDFILHDKFVDLFDVYCKSIEDDFLYCNLGGIFLVPGDPPGDVVKRNAFSLVTNYIISYEGAYKLLSEFENMKRLPIYTQLKHEETYGDQFVLNVYRRSSESIKNKFYVMTSSLEIPAEYNGISFIDDTPGLNSADYDPPLPDYFTDIGVRGFGLVFQYAAGNIVWPIEKHIGKLMRGKVESLSDGEWKKLLLCVDNGHGRYSYWRSYFGDV